MLELGNIGDGDTRWWRVRGRFGGNPLPWSTARSFTWTPWSTAPTDLWPNGETLADRVALRWAPVAGATSYSVQVASSSEALVAMQGGGCSTFANAISFASGLSGPCGLLGQPLTDDVYWRVEAVQSLPNGGGSHTGWSDIAHATFTGPSGPYTLTEPVIATPIGPPDCLDLATCAHETETPLLEWQPVAGAAFYRIQLHRGDNVIPSVTWDTYGTTFLPPLDAYEYLDVDDLSWQVVACGQDIANCPASMPPSEAIRRFVISPRPIELTPTPASLEGEVTLSWKMSMPDPPQPGSPWDIVQQPSHFWFEIDTEPTFQPPRLQVISLTRNTAHFASLPDGPIHWRVMYGDSQDPHGTVVGDFDYRFEPTIVDPPADAELHTPSLLRWDPVAGAVKYRVEVKNGDSWRIIEDSPWANAIIGVDSAPGPDTWRVTPIDAYLHEGKPVERSIVVAPENPVLVSPAVGAEVPTIGAVFEWSPVNRANFYRIQVSTEPTFTDMVETLLLSRTRHTARVEYPTGGLWWRVQAFTGTGGVLGEVIGTSEIREMTSVASVQPPPSPDTSPPTVTAPTHRLVNGSGASGWRTTVRLAWTGADAASGIARYELAQSTDGGAWTTVSSALTKATLDRPLAPNHAYRFRVRAIDVAGNVSVWMNGSTFRLTHYGETSSRIRYSGTWALSHSTVYWGSQAKASSQAGARATMSFTGRSIEWVSRKGPARGKAQIYINGVLKATVDLYASSYQNQRVVWAANYSTSTTRTISIRVLGTSGRPRVDLDAFVVGS
jgi:hypothetical protein